MVTNGKHSTQDVETVLAIRNEMDGEGLWFVPADGAHWSEYDVQQVRPLVVINPEDVGQVAALANAWDAQTHFEPGPVRMTPSQYRMQAALRSLIEPPKPEEPTGLGAVVEDGMGGQWIRHGRGPAPWMFAASSPDNRDTYPWSDIAAVRILSPGWSE